MLEWQDGGRTTWTVVGDDMEDNVMALMGGVPGTGYRPWVQGTGRDFCLSLQEISNH